MKPSQLKIGRVYFGLAYEDDDFTRPIVNSYEYLGVDIDEALKTPEGKQYFFRFIGSDERLQLKEHQLPHLILDVLGLAEELKRWAETQTARSQ